MYVCTMKSLFQHSVGLEKGVGLGVCQIYCSIVTVPHKMVGLGRMSDYRSV